LAFLFNFIRDAYSEKIFTKIQPQLINGGVSSFRNYTLTLLFYSSRLTSLLLKHMRGCALSYSSASFDAK